MSIPIPTPPYFLKRETAELLVGHKISKEIFNWAVLGHRILVALEPPKRSIGSIIIPSTSQKFPARGYVIAAGELVGTKWHPASGEVAGYWPIKAGVETEHGVQWHPAPWTILGARIVFGAYAGEALVFEPDVDGDEGKDWVEAMRESGMDSLEWFRSPYKMLTDADPWLYDIRSINVGDPSDETPTEEPGLEG